MSRNSKLSKHTELLEGELLQPYIARTSKYAVNPKYNYSPNREKLKRFLLNLDSVQACNRFEWVGVPKSIPAFRIEQMLYNRGGLVFFKQGNQFRLLPFFANEELNMYGLMKKVTPIAYNGSMADLDKNAQENGIAEPIVVDNYGTDENIDGKAVVLFDRDNAFMYSGGVEPIAIAQHEAIEQIVNRLCVLNVNLINSQGKNIIIVKDGKQANAVDKNLQELFNSDNPYAVAKANYDINVINNTIDYKEQEIWEDIMSWNNWRLANLGIQNSGLFNKKERQLTNEVDVQNQQIDNVFNAFYSARKRFIEQINETFKDDADFQKQCKDFDVRIKGQSENVSHETIDEQEGIDDVSDNDISKDI